MPILYRVNILSALKEKGYNTNRIRKEKLLAESTLQAFRSGQLVSWKNVERVCHLLGCQPGDILEYVPEDGEDPLEPGINSSSEGKIGEE